MSLTQSWAPYFTSAVRRMGRAHHDAGSVAIARTSNDLIEADVRVDGSCYRVQIRTGPQQPTAHCTCKQGKTEHRCEHLWSTLLALEADRQDLSQMGPPGLPKARKRRGTAPTMSLAEPPWASRMNLLRPQSQDPAAPTPLLAEPEVGYIINVPLSQRQGTVVIETRQRQLTPEGFTAWKPWRINRATVARLPEPVDRQIAAMLLGASATEPDELERMARSERTRATFALPHGAQRQLLWPMIRTGRCFLEPKLDDSSPPLVGPSQTDDRPWVLWLVARAEPGGLQVQLELRRGQDRLPITKPRLVVAGPGGLIVDEHRTAALDDGGAGDWIAQFRGAPSAGPMHVPDQDIEAFVLRLYRMPHLPQLDLPDTVTRRQRQLAPAPHISLTIPPQEHGPLRCRVWFQYDQHQVGPSQPGHWICAEPMSDPIGRDRAKERKLVARLATLGFQRGQDDEGHSLLLPRRHVPTALPALMSDGWQVSANQRLLRQSSGATFAISTSTDWFELRGQFNFGTEADVTLPQVLDAAESGRLLIDLPDGSFGLLPQRWLDEHALLPAVGQTCGDHLRFGANQAALLDALTGTLEVADVDEQFQVIRRQIAHFNSIEPQSESARFRGTLRPYQRDGLGWMGFMRLIGMGGILADDMGLGKTIQVLAMLDEHYRQGPEPATTSDQTTGGQAPPPQEDRPTRCTASLVVVPRSLIFNWVDEARRFAPHLRVLSYTGTDRDQLRQTFGEHDLIVTSYGLLRRDIVTLRGYRFHYVVLDEAQSIKNPTSQAARAARLLNASHRLALTGTPVENHLGDLWSIFEYLNPGMLGSSTRFGQMLRGGQASEPEAGGDRRNWPLQSTDTAAQAGRALRPFMLRRTKRQVLDELPPKTDQTLQCQMGPQQQAFYDGLLHHYQRSVWRSIGSGSLGSAPMLVLEALLRLRQAACHPGLIDPQRASEPSAKLQTLLQHLEQLVDEGHKALVFSQFTSMLQLVKTRLDERQIAYEYLDGQTRNRKQRIDHFQEDDGCPIFLISLKAGGFGLNLTAANYVFILDPWWNPAIEAQAIDRVHRIGQSRHVFAYRLICAGTVEQRIAELQQRKQQLANAIISGQDNLLKTLTREDLQELLR